MAVDPAAIHRSRRPLALITLYITERCNSRCVTCDYWRHGSADMNLGSISRLLPALEQWGTRLVVLSGGEPLLNPEWASIAQLLKSRGLDVWLLTSGLSLAKHARRAAELFEAITVSLDGTDRATYAAIRGLDAFDQVCAGIRGAVSNGAPPSLRVTLQRTNYHQMSAFVDLARTLGARQVSFLAVDVANPHAFGRVDDYGADLALRREDLPLFERVLDTLEREHAEDFRTGFIAESPQKLRRILQYFAAVQHQGAYPEVRCNAPEFSAVIAASGRMQPCFFIAGPLRTQLERDPLKAFGNEAMAALREDIRAGRRAECKTCVCSMWRTPETFDDARWMGSLSEWTK